MTEPRSNGEDVRWNLRQRFVFLEQRLYWEGRLQRSDLTDRFSISPAQASADIDRYNEISSASVVYDKSAKVFGPAKHFAPHFFEPDARQYLTQLLLMADNALDPKESWLGYVPSHDAVRRVRRKMDVATLRSILIAIHHGKDLKVQYQSMSYPDPRWRWIAPHALGFDGSRWHVRAWCFEKSMFNDFVIARVLSVGEERPTVVDPSLDMEWHVTTELRLGPHPGLSDAQKRAVELDYGMENGEISIEMRLSLAWYFECNLCLDLEPKYHYQLDPKRFQVVLLNRGELESRRRQYSSRRVD